MSDEDTRARAVLATAVFTGTAAVDTHVAAELAAGLLAIAEIAELAMPDLYFTNDSRCQLARAVLTRLGDSRVRQFPHVEGP